MTEYFIIVESYRTPEGRAIEHENIINHNLFFSQYRSCLTYLNSGQRQNTHHLHKQITDCLGLEEWLTNTNG